MKRLITIAVFAFTVILSAGRALAQVPAIQVDVPFNFTAGDKQLPRGSYTITLASPGVIQIRNRDRHISIGTMALPDGREAENGGELVFSKYGDRYFLHEVLCDYVSLNVSLPTTKSEKWVSRQEARLQNSSQVFLAAK